MVQDQIDQARIDEIVEEVLSRLCLETKGTTRGCRRKILHKPEAMASNVIPFPRARLG